jgi:uncharacterized protein YecE (DUF72 family)
MATAARRAATTVANLSTIRVGTSSWTDRSLTHDSTWYPRRTMKAAERIAFYAERFDLVEIETTYRFPPTPAVSQQWVDRTPDGFSFDLQTWSLLTGQPTIPGSLWDDLAGEVRPDRRDNRRLYLAHLSEDGVEECWRRFRHAVEPLRENGRLGALVLRFPRWFGPKPDNDEALAVVRARLEGIPLVVHFANAEWSMTANCDRTFDLLEDLDIGYACVDAGASHPLGANAAWAATSDLAYVRLSGRRAEPLDEEDMDSTTGPRWRAYLYEQQEVNDVVERIRHLADSCAQVHVVATTCWQDHAVRNATSIAEALLDR